MISATIQTEPENLQFVPGDVLRGRVAWEGHPELASAELRLFFYTAGKGTRDATVIDTRSWSSPGPLGNEPFTFDLPDGPYSFSGKLVSLIWALELVLDPAGHLERLEFTVAPTGHEIDLHRYPVPPEIGDKAKVKEWFRAERNT